MDLINLLLVPLIGMAAYYAFASASSYARSGNSAKAAGAMGCLLLAGCAFYLIVRAADHLI